MIVMIGLLVALFTAALFTPTVRRISISYGMIASARSDRWHKQPTALMGGIAICISWYLAVLFLNPEPNTKSIILMIGAFAIFLLGLVDDIVSLNPQIKLVIQIIVAAMTTKFGIVINIIPYHVITIPLTILWIVGVTNSFNLLDNMDGLSAGIAVISALVIGAVAIQNGNMEFALLPMVLAGAGIGFLIYNFNPAKIFMGDCGSLFLGYILSVLTIIGTWMDASNLVITLIVPLLVLGIPIFDTTFVTLTRKFQGRPISQGGKDHISHRLVNLGLTERGTVLLLYSISILLGGITIFFNKVNPLLFLILGIFTAIALYYVGFFLEEVEKDSPNNPNKIEDIDIYFRRVNKKKILSKRRIAEILIDLVLITVSYFSAFLLRFEGIISKENAEIIFNTLPLLIVVKFIIFYYMGLYRNMWKYIGVREAVDIIKAASMSSFIILIVLLMSPRRFIGYSRAVYILDFMLTIILLGGTRFLLLALREYLGTYKKNGGRKILIIGAGDAGVTVLREIRNNPLLDYKVTGFVDDDILKRNLKIRGVPVLGRCDEIAVIVKANNIKEVIIAIPSAPRETIERIVNICKASDIKYGTFPIVRRFLDRLNNGRTRFNPSYN